MTIVSATPGEAHPAELCADGVTGQTQLTSRWLLPFVELVSSSTLKGVGPNHLHPSKNYVD